MGLEMQERKVDYRSSWKLKVNQPISGNYYPINHGITIKDDKMTMEVLNDRPQGGSSLEDGEIEIMIQRRTYKDDSRGVHEPLNEVNPESMDERGIEVATTHYFRIYMNDEEKSIKDNSRIMQRKIDTPLSIIFGTKPSESTLNTNKITQPNSLFKLPEQVKAVFLPQEDGSIFARFENILDLFSASESVSLNVEEISKNLASFMKIKLDSVIEVSNTGLFTMEEMKDVKFKWKGIDYTSGAVDYSSDLRNIGLEPQRIRSFIIKFA